MNVLLYDTTLRDGAQREGVSFSLEDKVKVARALDGLGVSYIEGGWPGSNPKDASFFPRIAREGLRGARIAAFGSTRRPGSRCEDDANLRALVAAETAVVTLVGKSSSLHVEKVLDTTRDENLRMIADSVGYMKGLRKEVIFDAEHFFDGCRLDPDYAFATVTTAAEAGADCVVLCDTNGGELPDMVAERVRALGERTRTPLGIHTHDDGGLALANALAAVGAGCVHVQGTINGYGERCGNLDLIPLVATLQLKLGYPVLPPEQVRRLTEVSHLVAEVANLRPDGHAPYVGRSAFAHKAGIHVAAVAKLPESYQHVDPALVGNEMRVIVSELAGRRNIRLRARALGLDPGGSERPVLERIKELENAGFQFETADGSFEMLIRRALPAYEPPFELVDFTVLVGKRHRGAATALATVKLQVAGETVLTASEGDGPVNALDCAVRKGLLPHYPELGEVQLVDYKVRIVDEHLGTGARPRVVIESARGTERWTTVGCSTNIIEASWQALCDSLELPLLRRHGGIAVPDPLGLEPPPGLDLGPSRARVEA